MVIFKDLNELDILFFTVLPTNWVSTNIKIETGIFTFSEIVDFEVMISFNFIGLLVCVIFYHTLNKLK